MRWREFFQKDWVLKMISLGFAIFLWFFVIGEEKSELTISIPLELVNISPSYIITSEIPPAIDIRVYGPRSMVHAMATQRLTRVIDLKNAHQGTISVNITPDTIPTPSGVKVTMIQPSKIDISLEKIAAHIVKITADVQGKVADDYEIKKIEVRPETIELTGSSSEIKKVKTIKTTPVNVDGRNETFSAVVDLVTNNLQNISFQPEKLTVTINIIPVVKTLDFKKIPVNGLRENMTISSKTVNLTVKGPVSQLKKMTAGDIQVNIPAGNLEPGTHSIIPEIRLPEGFELTECVPDTLKITVTPRVENKNGAKR